KAASGYTVKVSANGLSISPVITTAINVNPAAATQLQLTTPPPDTVTAGSPFGLAVTAFDPFGNIDTSFGNVSVLLAQNPGNATVGGTKTVTAIGGVGTFSGLTLDKAANDYQIQVGSSALLTVNTGNIDVTPAAATHFVITTQPPATLAAGTPFDLSLTA